MNISSLIEQLVQYKNQFGEVEVRYTEYDVESDTYYLCHPTLYVSDKKDVVGNDQYSVVDPDEIGERVLEIG